MQAWLPIITCSTLAACGGNAAAPGPVLPVSEPAPVEAQPVEAAPVEATNAEDAKRASAEFQGQVRASAAAIAGCWNSAQSAQPELRGTQIQLSITARFEPRGLVQLSLSPMVTEAFAECVKARTADWKVALTQPATFKASVTLNP